MVKQVNEAMKAVLYQMQNINAEGKKNVWKNEPNRNSGVKNYNKSNKIYIRRDKQK